MRLRSGVALRDPLGRLCRLDASGEEWRSSEHSTPEGQRRDITDVPGPADWRTKFLFTLAPHQLEDFGTTCRWQETESPHFTEHRFCTIATANGRTTLMDDRLIERSGDVRTERPVDEAEVPALLRERFGISL
jgi:arylamine N-acetyltransferase